MMIDQTAYSNLKAYTEARHVKLAAVSKTHGVDKIKQVYDLGQRIFAENKAQEITEKQPALPDDIEWHFVGHLQRNKVKYLAPFIELIHAVDSAKLLKEIDKEARKNNRVIDCLLQIHIARDETKYGLDYQEAQELLEMEAVKNLGTTRICGLMGIATLTDDQQQISREFRTLREFFDSVKQHYFPETAHFQELSMGMSSDYEQAIEAGSTIIRLGSTIFGKRDYR